MDSHAKVLGLYMYVRWYKHMHGFLYVRWYKHMHGFLPKLFVPEV